MADASCRQGDLFESPPTYSSISIEAHQQMLELLKELLPKRSPTAQSRHTT